MSADAPRATLLTVAFVLVVVCQALAVPRSAGPDEPAHLRRAAGVVRGQVFGDAVGGAPDAVRTFDIPAWVGAPDPGCYAQQPWTPASCALVPDALSGTADLPSTAASNPVAAHTLAGIATFAPGAARTAWLSRLLNAVVPVALAALALARLHTRGKRLLLAAALIALTPMALFTFAVVNPSGWVIAGALAVWVAGLDLARGDPSAGALFAAGWAVAVLSRTDAVLWLSAAVVVIRIATACDLRSMWTLLRPVPRAVMLVATAASALWMLLVTPRLLPTAPLTDASNGDLVVAVVSRTGEHLESAIGVVGWLDAELPQIALYLWWAAIGVLAGAVITAGRRRVLVGGTVAVLGAIVLSWVLELSQAREVGLFWQGRYALPLLLGAPIVLATGAERGRDHLVPWIGAAGITVWNLAFLQALRRWGVGSTGSLSPLDWDTWSTPLPLWSLILVHVGASVALWQACFGRLGTVSAVRPHSVDEHPVGNGSA